MARAAVPATREVASPEDPAAIGPGQYFSAYITGPWGQAVIKTACFGPTTPGQTGHPMSGQTIEVELATPAGTAGVGYTGSAATSIVATLGPSSAASSLIATFTSYYTVKPIPTTLTVPCWGSGVVTFTPLPGSSSALPATVNVTFQGQP